MGRKSRNIEQDWDVQKKKLGRKQKKGGRKRWEEAVEREECYLGEQNQRAKRKGPPVAREWAAAKQPSIPHGPRLSRHWGLALLLRFGALLSRLSTAACSPSSSTAPVAWSTAPSAETSTCWCRGFESHATPPFRHRRPCPSPLRRCRWKLHLKELPRWRGVPWAMKELVLVTGLVLPMMASGLEDLGVLVSGFGLVMKPKPKQGDKKK
uniref:Uncharacterized protein n=1 Tax=Vitis vinifera TaxID=29760 RepID=F6HT12_VITVI